MIFEFGWYDWEDQSNYLLEHENKSQKEFWKDCQSAMKTAMEQALKFKDPTEAIRLEEIYNEAFNVLISKMGYREPVIRYGPFGNMCNQEKKDRDSRWALGTRLLDQMKEHNENAERLYEDRWK